MGRPLKKSFFGNAATSGQQITGYAWTAGDSQPRLSYIVKQKTTHSYVMASVDGTGVPGGGQVVLVSGNVTTAGQGNITVSPYGSGGSGAAATASLGLSGIQTVVTSGTGSTTSDYTPGDTLTISGGTSTSAANVTVNSVGIRVVAAQNPGTGYAVGNYFLFTGPGFSTSANVSVSNVDINGNITALSVTTPGVYTSNTLRSDPVTANSVVTTSGTGATFNIGWGVGAVSIGSPGQYSAIPSNPAAVTGGTGTGATLNLNFGVSGVNVTSGGSNYAVSPTVTFSTGAASATANLNGGSVSNIIIGSAGSYTSVPNVTIAPAFTTSYAAKITDKIVYTSNGQQYEWLLTGQTLPGFGWANLQSQ